MKRLAKIFLSVICCTSCLTFHTSCQTATKLNETGKEYDTISYNQAEKLGTTASLKENVLAEYVISAEQVKPNPKNGKPFDTLDYDKVIAYDFAGDEEQYDAVINAVGKFVPVVIKQKSLTQQQADRNLNALTKKSTYGESVAFCFQPHFALVLYKNNQVLTQINICLGCNYLISGIEIPAERHKKLNKGTEDEYILNGFTTSEKKAIVDLCKELNFTYGQKD